MAGSRLLLDTNIFIALEDPKIVPTHVAALAQKASLHGLSLFLDEACVEDIKRDRNPERRATTLSKLSKFPLLADVAHRSLETQIARFGQARDNNDRCDALLLDTLELGVVDFLVTEDAGIHRRAEKAGLRGRVLTVQEALTWVQRTYEPKEFSLPYIVAHKAHQISLDDPLFESLREDYPGFDAWFAGCRRDHRDCWTVEIDGQLAGLVIRKVETHAQALTVHPGPRILKICTLKMKTEFQGEKFGEQLLKKVLWFAQGNGYDLVYVTVFPKHELLISLLQTYGFEITKKLDRDELMMERPMLTGALPPLADARGALAADFKTYPRYFDGDAVQKHVVPMQADFHRILFPEIADTPTLPLFPLDSYLMRTGGGQDRTPGNTIRKVYVCRSPIRSLSSGDLLLFYLSKTGDLARSQTLTTVGVVEQVRLADSATELLRLVGRRSVYSRETLESMRPSAESPVLVIDFILNGHFAPPVTLDYLLERGVFVERPPQSIKRLRPEAYEVLKPSLRVSFE